MKGSIKYIFGLLILSSFTLFYFFKTNSGQENIKSFIENELSKKTNNTIKIHSLNFDDYPILIIKLQINNRANVTLKGKLNNENINMQYYLQGETFSFNGFTTEESVDIKGTLIGELDSLLVTGEGKAFKGDVHYSFKHLPNMLENVILQMNKVSSAKILNTLGEKSFIDEPIDIDAKFKVFSRYKQEGVVKIHMDKLSIPHSDLDTPFVANATINFHDIDYNYKLKMHSSLGEITVVNGHYNRSRAILTGDYDIHLNDLKDFTNLLKHQYKGDLDTNGTIYYNQENALLKIEGTTQKLEGELNYVYKNENIDLKLKGISLSSLLKQFSYPVLFSSKVYGTVNFDTKEQIVIINTKLKETRFPQSKLTDVIQERLDANMLSEVYDNSYFSGGYKDSILSATLKIDNGKDYLYLSESTLDIENNKIDAKFKMEIDGTEVQGEIYDTLTDPQLKIDKKSFATKRLDRWLKSH